MNRNHPAQREVRTFAVGELRAVDGDKPKIQGYAAKFNTRSQDLGGFVEMISPGAFANAIQNSDVRCLWDHLSHIVLGRNKSGTLTLREDETGLLFDCDPPSNQLIRDMVIAPIARGDVNQCSFAFRTIRDHWEKIGEQVVRTLLEVELFDVSPVTYPAYIDTQVAIRSMQDAFKAAPDSDWQTEIRKRRLSLAL